MAGTKNRQKSGIADSVTAIAHEFDTGSSLITAGAKLLSLKNATVEKFVLDKDGSRPLIADGRVWVVRPDQGMAGIQTALNAAKAAGGGTVQLLAGTYVITTPGLTLLDGNYITLQGMGDSTVLQHDNSSSFTTIVWSNGQYECAGNPVTKGDTSVYTTTPGNASNFTVGDIVVIRYGSRTDDGINALDLDYTFVTSVNGGTGEISLLSPAKFTGTSITLHRSRNNKFNTIKDLKFTFTGSNGMAALYFAGKYKGLVENVTVDGGVQTGAYGVLVLSTSANDNVPGIGCIIRKCTMRNQAATAIALFHQIDASVEDCILDNIGNPSGSFYTGAIVIERECIGTLIKNNHISNVVHGWGINVNGTRRRRSSVIGNTILYCDNAGIGLDDAILVCNNYLEDIALGGVTSAFTTAIQVGTGYEPLKCVVANNMIRRCRVGINTYGATHITVENNIVQDATDAGIYIGAHSIAKNNIVLGSSSWGIVAYASGSNTDGAILAENIVNGSVNGFSLSYQTYASLSKNVATSNSGSGLYLYNSTNSILLGNNLRGSSIVYAGTNTDNDEINNKV